MISRSSSFPLDVTSDFALRRSYQGGSTFLCVWGNFISKLKLNILYKNLITDIFLYIFLKFHG